MTERLLEKLDRLAAEAGIKNVTPEIYRFAQLLNDDKLKQWDEWSATQNLNCKSVQARLAASWGYVKENT